MGTSTLKGIIKESGITPESVEDTLDQLSDVLADQKEIEDAFHIGTDGIMGIRDDDVEDELEKLVKEEKDQETMSTQAQLDTIPSTSELPELGPMESKLNNEMEDELVKQISNMSVKEKRTSKQMLESA